MDVNIQENDQDEANENGQSTHQLHNESLLCDFG